MSELRQIKRALFSVSDKTGAAEFARVLTEYGVEIVSTGGTSTMLRESGISVTDVSEVTGFPEMMDGRVKTLHPKIHGGLLALRDNPDHIAAMKTHGIGPFDLVVVNLYPFEETVAKNDVSLEEAIENIDIGGPAMIRSASKNWRDVAVATDPGLYVHITAELNENNGSISFDTRKRLAALAYTRTASYDLAISSYLAKQLSDGDLDFLEQFNPLQNLVFIEREDESEPGAQTTGSPDGFGFAEEHFIELAKIVDLRYGENPHQKAALYCSTERGGLANAEQLNGKEMSFNNYVDAEAAWNLVNDFDDLAVAIIKHTNPSGVGVGNTTDEAYRRALSTDPVSAFGGIVAFNRQVDAVVAASVNEVFTELVIAPEFSEDALDIFRLKKNLRVLRLNTSSYNEEAKPASGVGDSLVSTESRLEYKQISGGFLVQEKDLFRLSSTDLTVVSARRPSATELKAMMLAWNVCKHVKSNAIVIADENQTIGVGSGQMNRVDSVRIAAMRAERFNLTITGAALASDAFFPFRDNVDEAVKIGVSAIIQPGGSVKDDESIKAADEHGISMVFTGHRHFKH